MQKGLSSETELDGKKVHVKSSIKMILRHRNKIA